MSDTKLDYADLSDVTFQDSCHLSRASFKGAKLVGAHLSAFDSDGIDFSGADLTLANLPSRNRHDHLLRRMP